MLIGFTYDLRDDYKDLGFSDEQISEFDSKETIDMLTKAISEIGHQVVQIGNVKNLTKLLVAGHKWDLVFNICEGLHGLSREAQVPVLLDIYQIPYTFSSPTTMITTLDKSIAKIIVKEVGVPTAEFAVINKIEDLENINLQFPLFAKPLAEGTGKGISSSSYIENKQDLEKICENILNKFQQPALVETFLNGREFTVGLIGNESHLEVMGVLEVILKEDAESYCHSYSNKENCEQLVEYKLVDDSEALKAAQTAKEAWEALGCKDAGRIDLRSDQNGIPHFLEANPLAGLHPTHSDLPILASLAGVSYSQLIAKIIDCSSKRYSISNETRK